MVHAVLAILIIILINEVCKLRGYVNMLDYIARSGEYWFIIIIIASLAVAVVFDVYILRSISDIKRRL